MKQTIDLMKPRYRVIAQYPEIERHNIKIGDIITREESAMYSDKLQDGTPIVAIDHEIFPAIFKKLEWWEERSLEVFRSIKYAKVTTYRHYWLVGDIVEVTRLYLGSPKDFYGFDLKGKQHAFCDVTPATEAEYKKYLKSKS